MGRSGSIESRFLPHPINQNCSSGMVDYEITSLKLSGEIPIRGVVPDKMPLCETLAGP